jgi:cytochrome c-type biogenesis protein CcmF
MVAEIGFFALVLALLFSFVLVIIPTMGLWRKNVSFVQVANNYVFGQLLFITIAYLALTWCFLTDDFSVMYVVSNSSRALPWFYKLCAVWGGHEGSMLLWVLILSVWMSAVALFSASLPLNFRIRVLVVLGGLSMGFLLFLIATSNPFTRQFQFLSSAGRDLNPLLQDPGFLFHPPMLYMGYVGFSVAFAFALAALWLGNVEPIFAKWLRPWTLAAWCSLTIGITLGSWWAYRELGWGGWWFWDPVENASFMPWLVGTALIHSLAVIEKREQFLSWTILLALAAFSLSLIGTFLVRSGVLTSVHAFAVDPLRGLYILLFLLVVIGGSLLLFATRAHLLKGRKAMSVVSRESALLLNNIFLIVMMLTVLMGTVYPLLIDGLGLGKLSVGAPYFNTVFVPLMIPFLLLMGVGVHLKWQQDSLKRVILTLNKTMIASIFLPLLILLLVEKQLNFAVWFGLILAFWVALSTLKALQSRIEIQGIRGVGRAYWGMIMAHFGIAVTVVGVVVSSGYGQQDDVKMSPGMSSMLHHYRIEFLSEAPLTGPNYHGTRARFLICKNHQHSEIFPEKRIYDVGHMAMTDSAIDISPFRDIYVALGEPLDGKAWSVRLYYKPMVRWIWAGGFLMLLGGVFALSDTRYYFKKSSRQVGR